MKIFLDDILTPLDPDWITVKTTEECINLLKEPKNNINILSLDHDLGNETTSTGYDVCKFLVKNNIFPPEINIHSQNIVGALNMKKLLEHYSPDTCKITKEFIKAKLCKH